MYGLAEQGGLVHQLLGYATDVDAGAAQAPLRADWTGRDVIQDGHLGAQIGGLFGGGQAARAASYHHQIIFGCCAWK